MGQPNNFARFDAHRDQPIRDLVGTTVQFRVSPAFIANDQCDRVSELVCDGFEPAMKMIGMDGHAGEMGMERLGVRSNFNYGSPNSFE